MQGKIFNFQRYSIHDGPGIRSILFLSGCNLRCLWCCNPESFMSLNRLNREIGVDEVMEWLGEDRPYFVNSGGGLTISGGEPLLQIEFVKSVLQECKKQKLSTAVETCGDVPWEFFESLRGIVDYYLYDIKCVDEKTHEKYTGAGNARIIGNLKKLSQRKEKIYLRIPLIPEYNLCEQDAVKIGQLAKEVSASEVHLLPYHRMGEKKYLQLNLSYPLSAVRDPMTYKEGKKMVEDFAEAVRLYCKEVYVGG